MGTPGNHGALPGACDSDDPSGTQAGACARDPTGQTGMMVADTGPMIAFARIGHLDLLHQVVGELVIPEAVYEELTGQGQERPGAAEVARGDWIQRRIVGDHAMVAHL